jgi:hypothetical protein
MTEQLSKENLKLLKCFGGERSRFSTGLIILDVAPGSLNRLLNAADKRGYNKGRADAEREAAASEALDAVEAMFTQPHPLAVDGWKLVPIEPTREMLVAVSALDERCAIDNYGGTPTAEAIYDTMLAAAPQPPSSACPLCRQPSDGQCVGKDCPVGANLREREAMLKDPETIVHYDDNSKVLLDAHNGGAHPLGAWSELTLRFVSQDGVETTRRYVATAAIPVAPSLDAEVASGWRDTASIPKDGTVVLAAWESYRGSRIGTVQYTLAEVWTDAGNRKVIPTHWMPLPPAPVEGTKS